MPKLNTEFEANLNFRVPTTCKSDLLEIDPVYTNTAREAILQYLPIKKLMAKPLYLPRVIGTDKSEIIFSISEDGKFQLTINGNHIPIEVDDIKILQANLFLFTLNSEKV